MIGDLGALDATALAERVAAGDVTPTELLDAALAAVEARNPAINAVVLMQEDVARRAIASGLPQGPFRGVPFLLKDLGCEAVDFPSHNGSRLLAGTRYGRDSAIYARMRATGVVTFGRTTSPEGGIGAATEAAVYGGPTRNPWNLDHSTGGSSGGSAAAVAAGMVAVGHANDGGGSIRVPASECGLVGLKPTRGRVSLAPDAGEAWAGATIDGAVTRSVRDAAAVLDAIAGYEPGDPYMAPPFSRHLRDEVGVTPGRLRIGVLSGAGMDGRVHAECIAAVERTAALLAAAGHHVEESAPAAMHDESFSSRFVTMIAAHTAHELLQLETLLGREVTEDDLEPDNLAFGAIGRGVSSADYLACLAAQHRWCRDMLSWWHPADGSHGFDLLLSPVIATPPPRIGYLTGPEGGNRVAELLLFTVQRDRTAGHQPAAAPHRRRSARRRATGGGLRPRRRAGARGGAARSSSAVAARRTGVKSRPIR